MNVLVLDTSTSVCAVSLYSQKELLATVALHQPNVHSERAALLVEQVLSLTKKDVGELNYLAVAKGPGSYTGLRIGFAIIKGMSFALGVPILGYSTLLGQACAFFPFARALQCPILSCIDAGRNEIYASSYDAFGTELHHWGPVLLPCTALDSFFQRYSCVLIVGNAAHKVQTYHPESTRNAYFFASISNPTVGLEEMLWGKIQAEDYESAVIFEPDYLKPVHITTRKKV